MRRDFSEERIFTVAWSTAMSILILFVAGIFVAPLLEYWGAHRIAQILFKFYGFGCHQISCRSWFICNSQMPVCVRCLATYATMIPAGVCLYIYKVRYWLGRCRFLRFVLPVFTGLLLPLVIDGVVQLVFPWESTNLLRFLTGSAAGAAFILLLGYFLVKVTRGVQRY